MATREMTTVNVEQLKIRLGVIAGRAAGIMNVDKTLNMAPSVDVAAANGTETFVFGLREVRAALHSAEQLALRFPGGTPLRSEIRNAIHVARNCFGEADVLATRSFENGDFAAAAAIAAEALARIDRDAAAKLIQLADSLPSEMPAVKRPHYLQYLMAYSDRSAAGSILAEIGV
ncbi:hypothetical protein [Lacipirellula parvula]|uniref:Uncharacterized protein n=1 Tax=Lacipirellula parvula TaxID=2650471 RepID=A0A5K7XHW0_9BACT|nr:hypothetical protein [Lacipirellula parvula]BBO32529.1 hypothetical protein PLANPX_2141 [Lacipirellula parvula]